MEKRKNTIIENKAIELKERWDILTENLAKKERYAVAFNIFSDPCMDMTIQETYKIFTLHNKPDTIPRCILPLYESVKEFSESVLRFSDNYDYIHIFELDERDVSAAFIAEGLCQGLKDNTLQNNTIMVRKQYQAWWNKLAPHGPDYDNQVKVERIPFDVKRLKPIDLFETMHYEYPVAIYARNEVEERLMKAIATNETVVKLSDEQEIFFYGYNAVFITKAVYDELKIDKRNKEIPSGECVHEYYKLAPSLIVVVDATKEDKLQRGFVTKEEYDKIKNDKNEKNYSYISYYLQVVSYNSIKEMFDEIMNDTNRTVVEKYIAINVLKANMHGNMDITLAEAITKMDEILASETYLFTEDEKFVVETKGDSSGNNLLELAFDDIKDVFEYLSKQEWKGQLFKVEKIDYRIGKPIHTFYYNEKLQLVDFEIHENEHQYWDREYFQ